MKSSLGAFCPNLRCPDPSPPNMRQSDWLEFAIIPALESVVEAHGLPLLRIVQFVSEVKREDAKPREDILLV